MKWDPDGLKVAIKHGEPCRCRILDDAIYIGLPCRRVGHRVTKRRIAQLVHALRERLKL